MRPKNIEFCGIPGSGKTTISHRLKASLTEKGHSVADFNEEFRKKVYKYRYYKVRYVLICLYRNTKIFKLFFLFRNNPRYVLHVIILEGFFNSSCWKRNISECDFVLYDQFRLQSLASLNFNRKNHLCIYPFSRYADFVIRVDVQPDVALERLKVTRRNSSRIDELALTDKKEFFNSFNRCFELMEKQIDYNIDGNKSIDDVTNSILNIIL